jgi:hypothetical protein
MTPKWLPRPLYTYIRYGTTSSAVSANENGTVMTPTSSPTKSKRPVQTTGFSNDNSSTAKNRISFSEVQSPMVAAAYQHDEQI